MARKPTYEELEQKAKKQEDEAVSRELSNKPSGKGENKKPHCGLYLLVKKSICHLLYLRLMEE